MDVPVNMMQFIGGGSSREIGQQIGGADVNKRNSSAITGRGHQSGPKGGYSEMNGINSNHTVATRGGVAGGGESSLSGSKQPQLMGVVYNR